MSTFDPDGPQSLRKRHLDAYRGFERLSDEELRAALDDPGCTPDRCCLIVTELATRGSDTTEAIPLLRWVLRGFDGNQTRYRAAITLARIGVWDGEVQAGLQHLAERYPRSHADARVAMELLENNGRPAPEGMGNPEMDLPTMPTIAQSFPRIEETDTPREEFDEEMRMSTGEALPHLEMPSVAGGLPASRIKIRKSRKTLAYPSVRNTFIVALLVILTGIAVALFVSQSGPGGGSLQVMTEVE